MKSPYFCLECRVNHDRHISQPVWFSEDGSCLSASDWYEMHSDEEDKSLDAWQKFAEDLIVERAKPLHKVFHNCGHMTLETHNQPLAWCRDCRDRRDDEHYEN